MASRLRILSVYVEEPKAGRFAWAIGERGSKGAWSEVDRSAELSSTYKEAVADGLLALQRMSEDLEQGPRAEDALGAKGLEANATDGADSAESQAEADLPATPRKPSLFGFGPAR